MEERRKKRKEASRSGGQFSGLKRDERERKREERRKRKAKDMRGGKTGRGYPAKARGPRSPGLTPAGSQPPGPYQLPSLFSRGSQAPSALWKDRGGCL